MRAILDAYDTRARRDPEYLTEAVLQTVAPFRPVNIEYEIEEGPRGRALHIRLRFKPNKEKCCRIFLEPWIVAYPDEMVLIVAEQFKEHWDQLYVQPDDHIELGTE